MEKSEKKKKTKKKQKKEQNKSKKKQIPLILHFFAFFCISPSVLAVFSKFDITFGTFPGSTTCISCVSFLLFAFLLLSLVAFFFLFHLLLFCFLFFQPLECCFFCCF